MKMDESYLAKVSWAPNSQAVYVRVEISKPGIPPLAIKATFRGFSHRKLTKGDAVEVERTDPNNATRYRVIRVLDERTKTENIVHRINVQDVDEFRRYQAMTMSKDRVRFFIGEKYFGHKLIKVLQQSFNISKGESSHLMQEPGFWVFCRPSQFARFMIYRNEAGIQNGFMDLRAELVTPEKPDAYMELADITGISREDVKKVVHAIGYTNDILRGKLKSLRPASPAIDVSRNPA